MRQNFVFELKILLHKVGQLTMKINNTMLKVLNGVEVRVYFMSHFIDFIRGLDLRYHLAEGTSVID